MIVEIKHVILLCSLIISLLFTQWYAYCSESCALMPPSFSDISSALKDSDAEDPLFHQKQAWIGRLRNYFNGFQAAIIVDELSKSIDRLIPDDINENMRRKYKYMQLTFPLSLRDRIRVEYSFYAFIFVIVAICILGLVLVTGSIFSLPKVLFLMSIILLNLSATLMLFSLDGVQNKYGFFISRTNDEKRLRSNVSHEVSHPFFIRSFPGPQAFETLRLIEEGFIQPDPEVARLLEQTRMTQYNKVLEKKAKEETGRFWLLLEINRREPYWGVRHGQLIAHASYVICKGNFNQAYRMINNVTNGGSFFRAYLDICCDMRGKLNSHAMARFRMLNTSS